MQIELDANKLAERIERAGQIVNGAIRIDENDGGYLSIVRAFHPRERALIIDALRAVGP
jgi:hypothetical protein